MLYHACSLPPDNPACPCHVAYVPPLRLNVGVSVPSPLRVKIWMTPPIASEPYRLERGRAGGGGTRAYTVDKYQHLIGFGTTQKDGGRFAETTGVGDGHARQSSEQFRDGMRLQPVDVVAG